MSDIGNIHNNTQLDKLQSREPKEARNIPPVNSVDTGDIARPDDVNHVKVIASSASSQLRDEQKDPLEKAAELIQSIIPEAQSVPNTKLRIDRDEESGKFLYQSVDEKSGEVVAQFPSEEILRLLSFYRELEGLAVDSTA